MRRAAHCAILTGAAAAAVTALPAAYAQEAAGVEELVVTGTRIRQPGVVSSSPIYSIGSEEIIRQQEPEIEKLLRLLPITAAGDNQNVNNGTDGAATIDLRGLGTQRNLVMLNGKRMVPFSFDGEVDTAMIPTALIERIDIVTGGASAVYGSDAISGAINVLLKDDFEGVDIQWNTSQTGEGDGEDTFGAVTLGANAADGRGNVVLSVGFQERDAITLGQRPLGQLGITTQTGANYAQFLAGQPPVPPPPDCTGPNAVATGGSGTTIPTRVTIAGGPSVGQFRTDGSLPLGNCSTFNFNPYNYYQTPLERYNGTVIGNLEFSESVDVYAMFNYGKAKVQSLVAPSGIFGSNYFTPLGNPLIGAQARQQLIDRGNFGIGNGTVNGPGIPNPATPDPNDTLFHNWNDNNGNGVVDAADDLNIAYFRRTEELGPRSEDITGELFQATFGLRGDLSENWSYDASFQYGESNRMLFRAGYTNVTNVGAALQTLDGTTCLGGEAGCVPINLFGGFGTITPEMAAYASASGFRQQDYEQLIASAYVTGSFDALQLPSADSPIAFSFGAERRDEYAREIPDECLKVQPTSCLGGAGGFFAPLEGSYDVKELFTEVLIPLVDGARGARGLDIELGYRYSDYNPSGTDDTWKAGINWRPVEPLLIRAMRQRAARAPNVGELADPQVTGLANATMDPCSNNPDAPPLTPELIALCVSTGMSVAQVGTVDDIIVGQINTFEGTLLTALPQIEHADTTTFGFVWTPDIDALQGAVFSLDYYDIDISDYIDTFSAQEVLDGCYQLALAGECAKIRRVGGNLILDGSGVEIFTQNLKYIRAEGIELGFSFGIGVGRGDLNFSGTANHYLTHEFQSRDELPVVECVGYFGTSCEQPRPDTRFIQRTTWDYNNLSVSAQWRHFGETERELPERTPTSFVPFLTIDSFDYLDLYASYRIRDRYLLSFGAMNVTDEEPPVVGNEAGDTAFNSGNTFPGVYETLGRTYTFQVNIGF